MMNNETRHIAIVPAPGSGHLIPLTELAKRLTRDFNFTITIFIPNDGTPLSSSHLSLLYNLPNTISHHFLTPVDVADLGPNPSVEARITVTMTRSVPGIRDSLKRLSSSTTRLVSLVVDLFGTQLFGVAREFGILPYMFFLSSGSALCCGFTIQKLHKVHTCEYRDLPEPVQIYPGSVPVHGADFPDPVQDRNDITHKIFLDLIGSYSKAAGILVNSFGELEPGCFKFLNESGRQEFNIPPVYHIGPVIRTDFEGELDGSNCLKWLDEQPSNSVLFVSFGSGGNLSHEQLKELALGLELSGQRFLWVVKPPHEIANASFFRIDKLNNPHEYLPQGFLDRTKGLGLVVPSWAPQVQVLSHGSIGGFLTHCGWNSILESIVHGIPMIAWPLYAEQKLNSVIVAEELKVGLRVKPNDKGLIEGDKIAHYAQCLIQGEQGKALREEMTYTKHMANVALKEGGSSKESLAKVAQVMMNHGVVVLVENGFP